MELYTQLQIKRGVTAIIGSGGKTTLQLALASELPGRVIVCTTTRIYPPALPTYLGDDALQVQHLFKQTPVLCVATPAAQQKLAAPALPIAKLAELADYVLVEADGSKHLPLKAHLDHEPVIPPETNHTILVAGISGLGKPAAVSVHRPEKFCQLCNRALDEPVRPEDLAQVISQERLCDAVLLNQMHAPQDWQSAQQVAQLLQPLPVYAAALQQGICRRLV